MNTCTLELTAMAHGGAALGRHEGKVVFVPYALPGETVRVDLADDQGRFTHAHLLEVLHPSPDRVPPPCPHFGPHGCGGCHWQHAHYAAQLRYKAEVVADQLGRLGGFTDPPVLPTLPDPHGWGYRNQARFHFTSDNEMGFYAAGSDRIVPLDVCPVLHPTLADLFRALELDVPGLEALTLRVGVNTGERMVVFEMAEDAPPGLITDLPISCVLLLSDGQHVNLVGNNHILERASGFTYRISAPSFFQSNTAQAEALVDLVMGYLDPQEDEVVLDGYCGVGLFSLPLAEAAGLVIAVESHAPAVEDLLENSADMENVQIVEGPVEAVLADLDEPLDAVVVDPPRTGLGRESVRGIVAAGPARIVYVSCDPATLARDAQQLTGAGYRLVEVQPVDMFPQTYHVETVSLFAKSP
ncbi:MAG: class I SAM-dependent RNA methyltransferase [Anaerolineae bacterium]|nr:class I SAM-dependent RNA methyltransferase [Anaerolineae bacterium]